MVCNNQGFLPGFVEVFVIFKALNADIHMEMAGQRLKGFLSLSPSFFPRVSFRVLSSFPEMVQIIMEDSDTESRYDSKILVAHASNYSTL